MNVKKLLFVAGSLFLTTVSTAQESDLSQIVGAIKENTKSILDLNKYESDDYLSASFIPIFYEGKVVKASELEEIDLDNISEIRLVFNDSVTRLFGNNGSQGVIIIEKLKSRQFQEQEEE